MIGARNVLALYGACVASTIQTSSLDGTEAAAALIGHIHDTHHDTTTRAASYPFRFGLHSAIPLHP